jgi:hypothetical protein
VTSSSRHLTVERLTEYLNSGVLAAVSIPGTPQVMLVINPQAHELAVEVPWNGESVASLSEYAHLEASVVVRDRKDWARLSITDPSQLFDAYPVLCAVADRIQLEGKTFNEAVIDVVGSFRDLLASLARLSPEREVGLFGELIVFRRLITAVGIHVALAAWSGPSAEEHDFGLPDMDLEVKTTTSEERRHWIGSLSQLRATPGRVLRLVSIQLTAAGAAPGASLPGLVAAVRNQIYDRNALTAFNDRLSAGGWRDDQADLYSRSFRLRTLPAVFLVSDTFPALTEAVLDWAGLSVERFLEVSYRLDLKGLPTEHPLPTTLAALELEGET